MLSDKDLKSVLGALPKEKKRSLERQLIVPKLCSGCGDNHLPGRCPPEVQVAPRSGISSKARMLAKVLMQRHSIGEFRYGDWCVVDEADLAKFIDASLKLL